MEINSKTRLLGIIGHPVGHSLSPIMHNAAFAKDGRNFVYVAMEVDPVDLVKAVQGLQTLGFAGFNVTMPHKENIIPLLDDVDETSRISGAVNTVVACKGRLHGTNTDGSGFVEACAEAGVEFCSKRVVVLGAGGAAAAVSAAILDEAPESLTLINRTHSRAEELARKLSAVNKTVELSAAFTGEKAGEMTGADVFVNTTYLGMKDEDPLPVPEKFLKPGVAVCDAVYRRGRHTKLVCRARDSGARVVTGDRMLLYQGVQAQRMWTGLEPNVEAMSDAISR